MQALARKIDTATGVVEDFGTVTVAGPDGLAVRTDGGVVLVARRAVSCLVAPEPNDRVLVASRGRECFVLAVLARAPGAAVELTAEGDLAVRLPQGALTLSATGDVAVLSEREVHVVARGVGVQAAEGTFALRTMALVGELLHADVRQVKAVAETVDSVIDRVSQRVKRSLRFIEEIDLKRAEQVDHSARQTMHLRAENALISAHKLAKVDGEQIHIG
jgi:hypothetical protein